MLQCLPRIQSLTCSCNPVRRQVPDPNGSIGDDQYLLGLAQPVAHCFGPELLLECIDSPSRHHGAPAQYHRTSALGLHSLAQAKTRAAINPMPPVRFLTSFAQRLGLPPMLMVAFPNVPTIQFNHQREGLYRPFEPQLRHLLLPCGSLAHLLIHFLTFAFGPSALSARLPVQGRPRQLYSG